MQERDRRRSHAHGFATHLVKPAAGSHLLDLIEQAKTAAVG